MAIVSVGGRQKLDKHHDCQDRQENVISSKTEKAAGFDLPYKLLPTFYPQSGAKSGKLNTLRGGRWPPHSHKTQQPCLHSCPFAPWLFLKIPFAGHRMFGHGRERIFEVRLSADSRRSSGEVLFISEESGSHKELWLDPAQTPVRRRKTWEAREPLRKLAAGTSLDGVVGASALEELDSGLSLTTPLLRGRRNCRAKWMHPPGVHTPPSRPHLRHCETENSGTKQTWACIQDLPSSVPLSD